MTNKHERIESGGIIISSIAAIATLILGVITFIQSRNLEELRSDFEQESLFSETLANAIEHLSSDNEITRRMAVVSLANSAIDEEQIRETVKVIILSSNSELDSEQNRSQNTNQNKINTSYDLLIELAALNPEKKKKYQNALNNQEIQNMLGLFPPVEFSNEVESSSSGEDGDKLGLELEDNLENKTKLIIVNEIEDLVNRIYSDDRETRRSAVNELSKNQWRSYDDWIVKNILKIFKNQNQNYFGIVNSLFILNKVNNVYLKSNQKGIDELLESADSILNKTNKEDYLMPIQNKLKKL